MDETSLKKYVSYSYFDGKIYQSSHDTIRKFSICSGGQKLDLGYIMFDKIDEDPTRSFETRANF